MIKTSTNITSQTGNNKIKATENNSNEINDKK
jgi:hypothetical protein